MNPEPFGTRSFVLDGTEYSILFFLALPDLSCEVWRGHEHLFTFTVWVDQFDARQLVAVAKIAVDAWRQGRGRVAA